MTAVPDECDCGSRLFIPVFGVRKNDEDEPFEDGNRFQRRDGYVCLECLINKNQVKTQITRDIPSVHETNLGLPTNAVDKRNK